MDQFDIIPIHIGGSGGSGSGGGQGQGGGGPRSSGGNGSGVGQVAAKTLSSQIFHLQQIVGGMQNKVISLISNQNQHFNTLNANVKHIVLAPGVCGVAVPRTSAPTEIRLSKCLRDLWVLWKEWSQEPGGGKPAKACTCAKQGKNKFSFLC